MTGRAGFVSGSIHAQNLQAGAITKTLGGTGTDTQAVTFKKKFKAVPYVVVSATDTDAITRYSVTSKTKSGFTLNIITSNLTSAVSFDYVAFDDRYF
jgi:hypothetical protein